MFLISRLWIDTLENRNAYGFEEIGFVSNKEEAERICQLEFIPKEKYPWPLKYTNFPDDVPRFIFRELPDLTDKDLKELLSI